MPFLTQSEASRLNSKFMEHDVNSCDASKVFRHQRYTGGDRIQLSSPLARFAEKLHLPPKLWIESVDGFGCTPLQRALIDGDMNRFDRLVKLGAHVNVLMPNGDTIIQLAESLRKPLPPLVSCWASKPQAKPAEEQVVSHLPQHKAAEIGAAPGFSLQAQPE